MTSEIAKIEKLEKYIDELDIIQVKIKTLMNELEKLPTKTKDPVELKARIYRRDLIREEILKRIKDSNLIYFQIKKMLKTHNKE